MKKQLLTAAALGLSLLLFSGCAGQKTNGDGSVPPPAGSLSDGNGAVSSREDQEDASLPEDPEEPMDPELEQLCRAALNYCEASTGYRPGAVRVDSVDEEEVTLQLYDDMGTHTATAAWYCIDPATLEGSDIITGEEIAFYSYMDETEPKT